MCLLVGINSLIICQFDRVLPEIFNFVVVAISVLIDVVVVVVVVVVVLVVVIVVVTMVVAVVVADASVAIVEVGSIK